MTLSIRVGPGGGPAESKGAAARRYPYPAYLHINGLRARGRDISQSGISAYLDEPLQVGETAVVTLGWVPDGAPLLSAPARIVRCSPHEQGFVVGLEFLLDESGDIVATEQ